MQGKKRVAIVGSGCAGIGALWALKTTGHEVHLYEAADRLGGHTNTVTFQNGDEKTNVDTGFIVFNTATYRQYVASMSIRTSAYKFSEFYRVLKCNRS